MFLADRRGADHSARKSSFAARNFRAPRIYARAAVSGLTRDAATSENPCGPRRSRVCDGGGNAPLDLRTRPFASALDGRAPGDGVLELRHGGAGPRAGGGRRRSEERRVGKSVDLGGRRTIEKKDDWKAEQIGQA